MEVGISNIDSNLIRKRCTQIPSEMRKSLFIVFCDQIQIIYDGNSMFHHISKSMFKGINVIIGLTYLR